MKVLIIGLGSIAKKHIIAINQLDQSAEIYALRSNPNSKSDIAGVIDTYHLNDVKVSELDFVLISNPTSEHFSTIQKLVEFDIPLFIEKPLFSEINNETQSLVDEIEKKGITTYVACNLRFLDCIKELKTILKDEKINEVNVYCGSYLPDWRPGVDFRTVYSANKEMGGGVHIDLIHELDYVYWLFGNPDKTNSFFSNTSSLKISAYDYANYLWTYKTFSASIILNYFRKERKRSIEVITDKGAYYVDLLKNTIEFNNKCIFASQKRIVDTYYSQIEFFVENILKGSEKFNTIEEANTILKLCMKD
ncbi:Gfo/Idh/MocA family oxidoreductase [Chryseobacterium aahli]|uniref:Gfo/Idh/MocA family protein n=1 Tax=Chryseobacterium aahli TaxID=1278643 RepID=UPI001F6077A4|nr:Gfo/Idh/MocA family oxidoreductase [Chryseobacterium aahli]MCI3936811.1 Gfo/Idh/MocA family oxidoreductase [Chryseobacterium aahli]